MFEQINSPFKIAEVSLKNRIVFAPTTFGLPKDEYYKKIEQIAKGGCGLIIIGDVPVKKSFFSTSLYTKKGFAHYQKLTAIAHANDCKISAQLYQSDANIKAMLKYLPKLIMKKISMEDLRTLLNNEIADFINKMPIEKVQNIIQNFGQAAELAVAAGFDMVQVHGDRMCGSFSSVLFNQRQDKYGSSPENRANFAIEAVAAIRKKMPNLAIDYKLAVRQENPHYGNAGVLLEELPVFVPLLEKAGVNSFHVTLANHTKLNDTIPPLKHEYFGQEGCFLKYCDELRRYTILPICAVGSLSSPSFIEEQLSQNRIQLAAMSRQLIADSQWLNKANTNQKINTCTRCNKKCLGGVQKHEGVHCIFDAQTKQ